MDSASDPVVVGPHDRPRPDGSDIRLMTAEDVVPAARSLADAFSDDPLLTWVYPSDEQRLRRLELLFEFSLERLWLEHGLCFTHVRHGGAALWVPPDSWHVGPIAQLRLLPGLVRRMRGDSVRLLRFANTMERNHPHEPAYYLPAIGVASAWQGRGFGAALLRPMLERCDAEDVPAYLEATSPRNRALYERHGFVSRDPLTVGDSPPFWPMWREPAASGAAASSRAAG